MCEICDKLHSMIDCLESLHSAEELRTTLMTISNDEEILEKIRNMNERDIRCEFAVNLFVYLIDKYDANPFDAFALAIKKFGDRMVNHFSEEEDE